MQVLVLGGSGMVGRKLIRSFAASPEINGQAVSALTAFDVVDTPAMTDGSFPFLSTTGDIADADTVNALVAERPDVIFHLAAIVSGEAELDFEKGYAINFDGTRHLLEAIRKQGEDYKPRVVYTSSIAVFGAPFPDRIPDTHHHTPLTSYGAQKSVGELLLADYCRRGFCDGIGIRLPTIVVRPGKPNKAASGFFSNIIREPLAGERADLPVDENVRHWLASPRSATGFLRHASAMTLPQGVNGRSYTMPGLDCTVGEMIKALRQVAGNAVADRIDRKPDPFIQQIVAGWPQAFDTRAASDLGFAAENQFEEIIAAHIEDELGGALPT
ncbi:MAG: D-erythronate dehydrogenase [Pseudomonadota bacterium]